jgi:hypothetical protein
MKKFFTPNLENRGRVARGVTGAILLAAALVSIPLGRRWSLLLVASALFTFYEASRGWCVLRACGIRTKL